MGQLRDQMDGDLRLKGFRPATRYRYVRCARSFAAHDGKSPAALGEAEVRAFLLHLVRERKAQPATVRMYVAALKFWYATTLRRPEVVARIPWPQVPEHLPDILTPAAALGPIAAHQGSDVPHDRICGSTLPARPPRVVAAAVRPA